MSTAVVPNPSATRPTPDELDELAERYLAAKKTIEDAKTEFEKVEAEAIDTVTKFGVVPPNAEQSRRLDGKTMQFTVTTGNTTTIDDDRVQQLKEVLESNKKGHLFANFFVPRVRHENVKGAEVAALAAGLSKRLTEKVQSMYSRCFTSKKKEPSLKVKKIVDKKPRTKKAKGASAVA